MLPVPVELRKRPWTALEGSNPVSLFHRCGCKWPIDDQAEQLFCNNAIHDDNGNGWCERHSKSRRWRNIGNRMDSYRIVKFDRMHR